jgi:membrane-associated protein
MDFFSGLMNVFSNLETCMDTMIFNHGVITYFLISAVIFCQTAFLITSFLPGDSLLFAVGALAGVGSLEWYILIPLLVTAAFLGNTCNYWLGYFIEEKAFHDKKRGILSKKNLRRAHQFYVKYGPLTIMASQFVIFIRTFAPFVAGIARMNFRVFSIYNLIGAMLWVPAFTLLGMFLCRIPFLKENSLLAITVFFAFSVIFLPLIIVLLKKIKKVEKAG